MKTRVLIIGGGGMVGQKLAHSLSTVPDQDVTLFDLAFPPYDEQNVQRITGSLLDPVLMRAILTTRPDVIYHLAAIVSGEAEADFSKGWQVNLHAFWSFLSILREEHLASEGGYVPRVVFTSSIAVFGAPFPDKIPDDFLPAPQTSYGAQKFSAEVMLSDFSRKGFVDGIALRLPTICVRPGKANKAASSFFSGIIREPLNGQEAILPVPGDVRHWHASPRAAVGFLRHAASLRSEQLGTKRALNLPGVSVTVDEQIEALRDIAGSDVVKRIKPVSDQAIAQMVSAWPRNFDPQRALALGFRAEDDFAQIIEAYIADDLPKAVLEIAL